MASPVAFGDIVAAIHVVSRASKALRDHGGARDDYQRLCARAHTNVSLLQSIEGLQALSIPSEQSVHADAIKTHAQKMLVKARELQRKLLPAEKKLGIRSRKGWHRGIVAKTRFGFFEREEFEKLCKDLEEDGRSLDTLLSLMNTERAYANERMTRESLDLLKSQELASQKASQQPTVATASSQQPPFNTPRIARGSAAGPILALTRMKQELPTHEPQELQVPTTLAHSQSIRNSTSILRGQPTHAHLGKTITRNQLVIAADIDLDDPSQRNAVLGLAVLCFYYGMLEMVAQMGLQLMPLILLMTPSASISLLLPDNFILHDALGRSHSLRVNDFCDWSVLESLVKSRFRDCIGSEKVQSGQYTIFDVDDPTFDLGANNWTQRLKSRGRFRMAIRLSGVRLVNAKCASCGTRLRYFDKLHLVCPNSDCAKLMRSHTAQKPTATMIKAITGSTGGFLEPPTDTGSSQSKMLRLQRLEERFSWMARGTGISWEKNSHGAGRSATTHAAREMSTLQSGTAPNNEGSETASMGPDDEDFDLDSGEAIAKQLQETPTEDTLLPVSTETTESQLLQEEEEMKYFRSICIKQDTTLYEAAVSRDSEAARSLIDMGVEVNSNLGPLGTALIPAILTRSLTLVRMFLLANADPMEKCWGYQTALSLAVSFGGTAVFELVLRFAVSQSSHRPPAFQYAVDGALYEATLLDKPHIIASLLVAGANPVKIVRGDRSAFDVVLARRLKYAWPRFFAALWDRQLLSDPEARFLYECLTAESEDWQPANSWLDSCARNLRISNAKTLSQRVTARLGKKCFFRHGSRGSGAESATTPIQRDPSTPSRSSGLSMGAATDVTILSGGWALSASPDSRIPGIFVDDSCVELPGS